MKDQHPAYPSAIEAICLVFVLMGLEYVIYSGLADLRHLIGMEDPAHLIVLATVPGNGALFTGLMHWKGLRYRDLFNDSQSSSKAIFMVLVPPVLLATPLLLLLMGCVQWLLTLLWPVAPGLERQLQEMTSASLPQLVIVCLIAPVLEEMLFRGIVLRSFLHQYERNYALLGSAVIFGIAHGNMYQLVAASCLGLVLGWLYERSRSLIPCIALHMAFNSGTMLMTANYDVIAQQGGLVWLGGTLLGLPAMMGLRRILARA